MAAVSVASIQVFHARQPHATVGWSDVQASLARYCTFIQATPTRFSACAIATQRIPMMVKAAPAAVRTALFAGMLQVVSAGTLRQGVLNGFEHAKALCLGRLSLGRVA